MSRSKAFEIILLGLWLLIVATLVFRYFKPRQEISVPQDIVEKESQPLPTSKSLPIKRIVQVDSDTFDITLREGDRRLMLDLPKTVAAEAKSKTTQLLNKIVNPRCLLQSRRDDGRWVGTLIYSLDGKDQDIMDWLQNGKFVYD